MRFSILFFINLGSGRKNFDSWEAASAISSWMFITFLDFITRTKASSILITRSSLVFSLRALESSIFNLTEDPCGYCKRFFWTPLRGIRAIISSGSSASAPVFLPPFFSPSSPSPPSPSSSSPPSFSSFFSSFLGSSFSFFTSL